MSQIAANHGFTRLSPAASRLGAAFARPRIIAALCVVTLAGLGWAYLGLLAGGAVGAQDNFGFLTVLCRPAFADSAGSWGAAEFAFVLAMWGAMTLAMMLPSASPMILTYAEIADTAARKGAQIVSPFALAAGYATIWLGFALAATILQALLTSAALIGTNMQPASLFLSGALFIGAGLYQFSALKQACLALCRQPFPFFMSNWTTSARGVFRLGLRQGLHCLGCCWAMMLLMFAIGVMNVVWMAALGVVMTVEKLATTPRFSRFLGAAFVATGAAFVAAGIFVK